MKRIFIIIFMTATISVLGQEVQLSTTDKAITEMQNENYTKALTLFNKALLSNPKDKEALQYRAYTKYKQKDFSSALTDINKALVTKYNISESQKHPTELDKPITPNLPEVEFEILP